MDNNLLNEYLGKEESIKIGNYFTKILLSIVIVLLSLIFIKMNDSNREFFEKYIFSNTFDFSKFNHAYNSLKKGDDVMVFKEANFNKYVNYLDGIKMTLDDNIVKSITSGIVVYIGNMDDYNKTVIIQGSDGYDIWYGNLENVNVQIYDYIDSKEIIGNTDNLFMKVLKDGKVVKPSDYFTI